MTKPLVVGIDLSLTGTGVAIINPDNSVSTFLVESKGTSKDTLETRYSRKIKIVQEILDIVSAADLVVIEGPAYASKHGKAWDRAGLWWSVVSSYLGAGSEVVEVPPTSRAKYACGKSLGKDQVLAATIKRYSDVYITNNNIADAVLLAAMGRRALGHPIESSLPKTHLDAMAGADWSTVSGES